MTYQIQGEKGTWEVVIGMEVHAQVIAESKLFSGAAASFGAEPNSQVSLVDAAMPGMLPVLNEYCVEQAIRTGLGLNAQINKTSVFERKNYFYPDLPQGYQISQFLHPIVGKGEIEIDLPDGSAKTIGITRLHLEQDAGKSVHDQHPTKSYVDLNRSGCALMEIVSEPDIRSPDEATAYLSKLRMILRYLDTCDGNMEEGSMRADVNISVRKPGDGLGTRCEVKNVNSLKAVQQAIEYEAQRQVEIIESGGTINQETRLWDPAKQETRSMRSKEEAHDYRYFPEPDLVTVYIDESWKNNVRESLPELPHKKAVRFTEQYGLPAYDAGVLTQTREISEYFENICSKVDKKSYKAVSNWVMTEVMRVLNDKKININEYHISEENLASLINLIAEGKISNNIAKEVYAEMLNTSGRNDAKQDPVKIVTEKNLMQVTDTGEIEEIIKKIIADNPKEAERYRAGETKLLGLFVGKVMKESKGKANPKTANELVTKLLGS